DSRRAVLAGALGTDAPLTGLRTQDEIETRIAALKADAEEPPISNAEMEGLDALLAVRETLPYALSQLHDLRVDLPAIRDAVTRVDTRADALAKRGVDVERLEFEASYGRTSMEYYDGFVFGFYAESRPDLPPVATGGRYDALTQRLGGGAAIPAVGAVLRPDLMALLEGAL
ncbi:MAG: ATP phosphoribosyltransferase regulatory subunit, partial [Pseudomonadota bacterium]